MSGVQNPRHAPRQYELACASACAKWCGKVLARVLAQVPAGVLARVLARFYGVCALPLTLDPKPSLQSTSSKPYALNLDKITQTSTQVAVAFTAAGTVGAVAVRVAIGVCAGRVQSSNLPL